METLPLISQVGMIHLVVLCLWGGVVAAESVLELLPFRKRDFHSNSIEYHFWIDLLVELPLIAAVVTTGTILVVLAWPITGMHLVKIGCALVAVSANLICVALVLRRRRLMNAGSGEDALWKTTRRIVLCAVVGLPFAAAATGLGFWLAYHRMLEMLGGG